MSETDPDELIDQLDDETVLRVPAYGHTDQFLYRFPSGIMTVVWGDSSVSDGSIGLMSEDHALDVLRRKYDGDEKELVPFEESPYAEDWISEAEQRRREQDK